jgi:hypothetical protein
MSLVKLFLNNTKTTILSSGLTKQGERAIDQFRFELPSHKTVAINNSVIYLQDVADIDNLSAIYNFQSIVSDESGYSNNGTATSITYGDDKWNGKCAIFNGSSSRVTVPDSTTLAFTGQFDVFIWAKWTATTTGMYLLSKRIEGDVFQDNVYQNNVFSASTDGGIGIQVNAATAGDVRVSVGPTSVTSSSAGFNDGNWHLIRVSRNSANLVTLYVDNISKGTATVSGTMATSSTLYIGSDFYGGYFNGNIARVRLYKDGVLLKENATKINSKRNPRSTILFGGKVTKISNELGRKDVIAQSFGKIFAETEIRGQVFTDRTPEYIVETLVEANTTMTYVTNSDASGITLSQYTADGKLIDILKDFSSLTNRMFYTTGTNEFVFDNVSFNDTDIILTHGATATVTVDGYDDTEIVNDLTILGENLKYRTTETFNGDNSETVFTLENNPIETLVKISSTEKTPEIDYIFDTMTRTITFTTAPASGTNNISVEYVYEKPLYIRGTKQSSIDVYGVHAKRLNLPWINNRQDGVRFVQAYLNKYKDIQQKVKVNLGTLSCILKENDIIHVKSTVKGIDADFVIKSIRWSYPESTTELELGEYFFDYLEYDKEIVAKIHDIESAMTVVKDIRDYESPEESIAITESLLMRIDKFFLTESLSMTDVTNIYDKLYNTYSSGSVTTTFQPNIFQTTVFRTQGFTNPPTSATYGSRVTGSVYVSD